MSDQQNRAKAALAGWTALNPPPEDPILARCPSCGINALDAARALIETAHSHLVRAASHVHDEPILLGAMRDVYEQIGETRRTPDLAVAIGNTWESARRGAAAVFALLRDEAVMNRIPYDPRIELTAASEWLQAAEDRLTQLRPVGSVPP